MKKVNNQPINWTGCKGCECYQQGTIYKCSVRIYPLYNDNTCPCLKCLVKMCCSGMCDEFYNYFKNIKKIT
jgi:hypothetical protein